MFYLYCSPTVDIMIKKEICQSLEFTENINDAEGIIVLGGDGSLLNAIVHYKNLPMIYAVNFGSCGILMPFQRDDLSDLISDLKNNVPFKTFTRKRFLMNDTYFLNECVFTKNQRGRLNKYQIYIDNEYFKEVFCDSVIISTPTGSSGYNLSAGGPFVSQDCDVIIITLISPFRTFLNSFVVASNKEIEVRGVEICIIDGCYEFECNSAKITFDGNLAAFAYSASEKSVEKVIFDKIFNRK